jgi:hypothetical protein
MTELPTIQEAFEAILVKKRAFETLENAFYSACTEFKEEYKLQPPYLSHDSYRVVATRKMRVRRL